MLKEFSSTIKTARLKQNLSLRDLAELTGLDHSYIGRLEKGGPKPSRVTVLKLAKALKIPENILLEKAGYSANKYFDGVPPNVKSLEDQDLSQLPPEIWRLVVDKNNYSLLKQIQAMKNKGYSNELIIEWLTSLENTLENIKKAGVYWGGEYLEESKKYTKQERQEMVEGLKKKLSDPNFKPPWRKNNVE